MGPVMRSAAFGLGAVLGHSAVADDAGNVAAGNLDGMRVAVSCAAAGLATPDNTATGQALCRALVQAVVSRGAVAVQDASADLHLTLAVNGATAKTLSAYLEWRDLNAGADTPQRGPDITTGRRDASLDASAWPRFANSLLRASGFDDPVD